MEFLLGSLSTSFGEPPIPPHLGLGRAQRGGLSEVKLLGPEGRIPYPPGFPQNRGRSF